MCEKDKWIRKVAILSDDESRASCANVKLIVRGSVREKLEMMSSLHNENRGRSENCLLTSEKFYHKEFRNDSLPTKTKNTSCMEIFRTQAHAVQDECIESFYCCLLTHTCMRSSKLAPKAHSRCCSPISTTGRHFLRAFSERIGTMNVYRIGDICSLSRA